MDPANALRPLDVVAVIMGGGAGTRLFPLTKDRSKPAVPLGGKYRLVDIPISNCINSELRRIFVLTQFNSSSLHRHIQDAYRFDVFAPGFVEILAAQQTPDRVDWYQGTADAVRQNLVHLANYPHKLVLILSGDQLYRMDFRAVLEQHIATGADATVATIPVARRDAGAFGIMQVAPDRRITRFVEKPQETAHARRAAGGLGRDRPAARERRARLAPGVDGHLRLQAGSARRGARGAGGRLRQARHPVAHRLTPRRTPTSIRATGRTSVPSAPSTTRTSISASRCRSSTSTTPRRRSSPTRATCRPARSSAAASIAPSSPTAASSTMPSSSIRSSASGAASRPGRSSAIR